MDSSAPTLISFLHRLQALSESLQVNASPPPLWTGGVDKKDPLNDERVPFSGTQFITYPDSMVLDRRFFFTVNLELSFFFHLSEPLGTLFFTPGPRHIARYNRGE
jgi:hypothetical protein